MIAPGQDDDTRGTVTPIGGAQALPDMTALELAVIVALLQTGPSVIALFSRKIEDWFSTPLRPSDLDPSLRRLRTKGWLSDGAGGELSPTIEALEPTRTIYSGLVRMIGSQLQDAADTAQLNLIDDTEKE